MKRLIIVLALVLTIIFSGGGVTASADTYGYARANSRTAYFFSERDISTSLFAVPYTYCIEILREEGDWYYAKYAEDDGIYRAVYGYCRKSDFDVVEGVPEVTYLHKTVTVTYTTDVGGGALPVPDEINIEAAFYGTYYAGATAYSYVLCRSSFGYIEGANEDYPLNELPEDETPETPPEEPEGMNAGLISAIVICSLAVAAFILLYFTTKRRPQA